MEFLMCKNCNHNWLYHHDLNDEAERWIEHGCDYWEGCDCKEYLEDNDEDSCHSFSNN